MTDQKHTQGKIAAFTDDYSDPPHTNLVAVTPRTTCVLSLAGRHKKEPDIARLVSCWNTMHGIDDPEAFMRDVRDLLGRGDNMPAREDLVRKHLNGGAE